MDRARLRADCTRCVGLCCVALGFPASAEFAIDKPPGVPCPNLRPDCRCAIHDRLSSSGFRGCVSYDCFGAGQRVVHETLPGRHWREPEAAPRIFAAFRTMRALHELLWYLTEARELPAAVDLRAALDAALAETERLAALPAADLERVDVEAHRSGVNELLRSASALARARLGRPEVELRRADLIGRDLRGADLRGADLRGALLIRADLRGADLRRADLIGADCRGAELHGANLATAIFLTQNQVDSADGDSATALPHWVVRPAPWMSTVDYRRTPGS